MRDEKLKEVLVLLADVKALLARQKHVFEQFLLTRWMRTLILFLGIVLTVCGFWLIVDGKMFCSVLRRFSWMWWLLLLVIMVLGGILKFYAWKSVMPEETPFKGMFQALGRSLFSIVIMLAALFVVIHVWIVRKGFWWYLLPVWAIGMGMIYFVYAVFLRMKALAAMGVWLLGSGVVFLFWLPQTLTELGWAIMVAFGFSFVVLAIILTIQAVKGK